MIDVFYDAGIVVIFSAENAAELLGINNRHAADFARTESRMMEMQSEKYFSAKLSGVASF
jgi:predicted ATPase